MKSYFRHRLLNEPFEDPCLVVGIVRQKRILLFDIGDIHRLSQKELNKVSDVFVTHMHIDHFIGFDTLLRGILKKPLPLRIYGPEGLIECLQGKLKGYTWNLITAYPFKIEAFEIDHQRIRHFSFYAEKRLVPIERDSRVFHGTVLEEPFFRVSAMVLSHSIPVLAFRIDENIHINIDKDLLLKKGLEVGPWLSQFKEAIVKKDMHRKILAGNKIITPEEIKEIAIITEGQKISYVMDVSVHDKNIDRLIEFIRFSDYLYCEAYFLHDDMDLAIERNHLTARITGQVARMAGVKNLIPLHFSLRYKDNPELILNEVNEAFSGKEEK